MFYTSYGRHSESYVSAVHSSSGDCCQLYTLGSRHRLSGCHVRQTHICVASTHFKCLFSECTSSSGRLGLSVNASYVVCHLLHPLPHIHTHRHVQPQRLPRSVVYVCSLQITHGELSRRCVYVCLGGRWLLREETEQRRVLLPSTRTQSALYDNVRVQERQS